MPSPKHVQEYDKGWQQNGEQGATASASAVEGGGRKGIALENDESSGSYLSPSRLMANMGMNNIRDYLPSQPGPSREVEGGYASWQQGDLGDGHGRRPLLLLSTPLHILQIFALPLALLSADQHVEERFNAPEEVLSIPTSVSASARKKKEKSGDEKVVSAKLMDGVTSQGPLVLLLLAAAGKVLSSYSLAMLSLRTGEVVKRVEIGNGQDASLSTSRNAVVVAMSDPTPSLYFFDPSTLDPLRPALTDLPTTRSVPTFALSGRLLAYTVSDPPLQIGKDGLGSLITSSTSPRPSPNRQQTPPKTVIDSAVGIGGGVARGVWAGIKMGAQAASRATNGRMAISAPTNSSLVHEDGESESRSLDDSSLLDESTTSVDPPSPSPSPLRGSSSIKQGGEWIKIVDLASPSMRIIAHFKLPRTRHTVPTVPTRTRRFSETGHAAVSHLAFSPDGTTLFAAPVDGRSFHLFDIHPQAQSRDQVQGEVWHTYELRRGNTISEVVEVDWSDDARWIGVATGRGTVHVFAINPSGGGANAFTHTPARLINPIHLPSLSTTITPSARLRMRVKDPSHPAPSRIGTTFTFRPQVSDPLRPGTSVVELAIYRSSLNQLDLARLSISSVDNTPLQSTSVGRRGSGLTEMMKARVGISGGDLDVSSEIKCTWVLPPCQDGVVLPMASAKPSTVLRSARNLHLAYAEIQSFSSNPALLPLSIYLSHQIDFYDAKPIDEYSRLSILDPEARTRRLQFRPEVEIRPPSSTGLNEPLITAIHSVIESSPSSELPYLPNEPRSQGYYGYGSWKSIPIQQVKEGMGHLRSQYVRNRRKRQIGTGLSFEDDAVFADDGEEGSESSPMSSGLPTTEPDEGEGDEEWSVRWEDEYRQAVEDDGGPDDLVLGLMDEQQEERRRWVEKQRGLAREFESGRQASGAKGGEEKVKPGRKK